MDKQKENGRMLDVGKLFFLCYFFFAFQGCLSAQLDRSNGKDHGSSWIAPVEGGIVSADDQPWVQFGEGVRGKIYFSDRMTLVYLEMLNSHTRPKYPAHQHHHEQMVYVLEGQSMVQLGDEVREVGPGDAYVVPSNTPHTFNPLTDRAVVIEVFTPTREDFRPK